MVNAVAIQGKTSSVKFAHAHSTKKSTFALSAPSSRAVLLKKDLSVTDFASTLLANHREPNYTFF